MPTKEPPIMSHKNEPLQHHFVNLEQQYSASSLGMWVFLVTEVLFFGGLFCGYTIYRMLYPEAFGMASNQLDVTMGAFNTAVLIASSFTMVLAVHSARFGKKIPLIMNLILTLIFGSIFLGVKAIEYSQKWAHHLVPGVHFSFPDAVGPGAELFYCFYFAMTGLHAFHMVIGFGLIIHLIINSMRGKYTAEYNTPVDMIGLYWHLVDIVWIFLFPLLYLIARV